MKIALLYEPSPDHLRALRATAPAVELAVGGSSLAAAREAVRGAAAVLGNWFVTEALADADQALLQWVQTPSAGVEKHLPVLANPRTRLTNARGLYDEQVADHALALALGVVRGIGPARDRQRERSWERAPLPALGDHPALVLGLGGVGSAIARRLAACRVLVRGMRRRPELGAPEGVAEVLGPEAWRAALPDTGLLVVALPLTEQTRGFVGRAELAALPPHAVVVNIARGEMIDEPALCEALAAGRLRGAGLDVFVEEPLPPASPLWSLPSVLMTPHLGRTPEGAAPLWEPLFLENVRRFVRGEALLNLVSREDGY